ncbi:23S rRNA (adenine(1618)-N(6))-methyltransferase RlmF [Lutibacter sp. HS1-25]|uniref:23S rRNA (adenine(1618)-N(6))-methyltransferase RlmF n=1 Tax=Lutibacter sp. HS1-25 TaxID=2485000 RepID=UPI00101291AF|nr:23S rRNA (adenine(1618)-N(6))-methyltransferase RlmF [Lutibacter sp. HS1-25]RXP53786.1 23S rRNA (adenine(1618)-N(6))-methyltransferase RlmF [Lutibacter sp. HS1-25]
MKNKNNNSQLHSENVHQNGYQFSELIEAYPTLKEFVFVNKYNTETINFADPKAVKALNTALLFKYYYIAYWDFPDDNLCPPIPGRVDYIHHLADLLKNSNITKNVNIIDVGVGANCIYPLLGNSVYSWRFLGTDIDKKSIDRAEKIVKKNALSKSIQFKQQKDATQIFQGILNENDKFSATMCNPPFYRSQEEAMQANARKLAGLGNDAKARNFSGKQQELWYKGGEKAFIHTYLYESSMFKKQCFWYTTLVSKKENVQSMYDSLSKLGATEIKTIPMHQGNKVTRVVAWTFLTAEEQSAW